MSATAPMPILPDSTIARILAGLEVKLNPNGTLTFKPKPSTRDRAILRANRDAVLRLAGLSPVAEGDGTGEWWAGQERATTPSWLTARSASSFGSLAADLGADLSGIGAQDFTFDFLFPKQVREYRPGRINRSDSGNH